MAAAAARIPATEIEAYEDDRRLHFDGESDFPRFLYSVLQRTDQISQMKVDEEIVKQHIVVVVEPISLDKRHSVECYVMDVVDPLNPVHSTAYRSLYSSPKPGQG